MNKSKTAQNTRLSTGGGRSWWTMPIAFLITLAASPAQAGFTIPDAPLTMAARVAPNILFILDDSGSMAFNYMPDSVPNTTAPNVAMQAYTRNTLFYNPQSTYLPWMNAAGARMSGGTSYSAAYGSFNLVGGGTIDLGNSSSCRTYNYNSYRSGNGTPTGGSLYGDESGYGTQVCGGVQTFYVPQVATNTSATYLGNGANYYRYQILAGGADIQRGEWGAVVLTPVTTQTGTTTVTNDVAVSSANSTVAVGKRNSHTTDNVTAGVILDVGISVAGGRRAGGVTYSVFAPGSATAVCTVSVVAGNSDTCRVASTVAGKYSITVNDTSTSYSASYSLSATTRYQQPVYTTTYTSNACDSSVTSGNDWINCVSALPNTSRTLAQELVNYATWFSYHRTRTKSAKAGAAEAFSSLDSKVRVGFRTIWNRNNLDIPVNDGNDGRFVDVAATDTTSATTSRTTWYSQLFGVMSANSTPLHGALDSAGQYFSGAASTGPYGPQSGNDQFACRQNFTILTTDGYWNSSENYSGSLSQGAWSNGIGEQDNSAGTEITGPNNQSYTYSPAAPYKSSDSGTLADVAMKYWKSDLRTDMANLVPTSALDPAFWQHMVTFGISIGLAGTSGWKSVAEVPANAIWSNPNDAEDSDRIDDLLHSAVNGRGAFVAATNPSEFNRGLSAALAAISERTSSYSNVTANSVSLSAGSQVFSASYVSGKWSGNLTARALTDTGIASGTTWAASVPTWSSRKIYTMNGTTGANFPTAAQITALDRSGGGVATYPVTGSNNADYIRGDQSREGSSPGQLRIRTSLLGDIVGSSPAYVKDSNTLYVGANDGMLHAFDASNGVELFAYVPGIVNLSNLSTLSRGDYGHKFLVDGPVVVSSRQLTPNQNLLVGTLGRGGKGLYSLDVTNPATPAASMAKWERNETPGSNMGYVLGEPMFAKTANSSTAVVFGNGINSTNNKAVLIVLDATTGNVIREIDTGEGSATAPNGLSPVTGILGADGRTMAYVYAGDMLGNVWKFDLTNAAPANWTATKLFATSAGQPITGGVTVATDPATLKRWVFFGTGSFLTSGDANTTNAVTQSMYGIIDSGTLVAKTDLTARGFSATTGTSSGFPVRAFDSNSPLPANSKGWYIDLPEAAERIVQDAQMAGSFLVTASMVPVGSGCGADGSGYINALNAFTGTAGTSSFFDLDNNGSTDDSAVGGQPVGSVNLGIGMPTRPNIMQGGYIVDGTGSNPKPGRIPRTWARTSWREIRKDS